MFPAQWRGSSARSTELWRKTGLGVLVEGKQISPDMGERLALHRMPKPAFMSVFRTGDAL